MASTTALVPSPAPAVFLPAPLFAPTPKAAKRVLEFFATQINNDHTRKAYMNATRRFAQWCEAHGIGELAAVEPSHIAAFIKKLERSFTPPTVKQHLAALRMLFDWLVIGHVIDVNPAHAVRGPKYVVKKGKTPVLTAEEARELLDSIPVARNTAGDGEPERLEPALVGLRDRALIAVMVYSFARINAVLEMKVRDYFVQGRRGWVRLHEKGGKEHEVPCHHNLEIYLDEYIAAAGIAGDKDGPLFRTAAGKTGALTGNAMWQQDAYRMIQRRAADAGIETRIGNHTFRATGITAYLKNNGTLEAAQHIANHENPRTTKLYDRRDEEISLDEVEKLTCDPHRHKVNETIGWAAKILNMVTKVEVYLSGSGHPGLKKLIHPPIDNTLIEAIIDQYCRGKSGGERSREIKKLCSMGKPINSIKKYDEYLQVIEGLKIVADLRHCSLFEVETLFGG